MKLHVSLFNEIIRKAGTDLILNLFVHFPNINLYTQDDACKSSIVAAIVAK